MKQLQIFFEVIIDGIIAFTDFFIVGKHITLSEATLFALSFSRAIWFTVFGVNIGPQLLSHEAWTPFFWLLTIGHIVAVFFENKVYRIAIICSYALVWCFLALLVAFTAHTSPALPTFLTFAFLSVFIAVRLLRDWRS